MDVNGNGASDPLDVLEIINEINRLSRRELLSSYSERKTLGIIPGKSSAISPGPNKRAASP